MAIRKQEASPSQPSASLSHRLQKVQKVRVRVIPPSTLSRSGLATPERAQCQAFGDVIAIYQANEIAQRTIMKMRVRLLGRWKPAKRTPQPVQAQRTETKLTALAFAREERHNGKEKVYGGGWSDIRLQQSVDNATRRNWRIDLFRKNLVCLATRYGAYCGELNSISRPTRRRRMPLGLVDHFLCKNMPNDPHVSIIRRSTSNINPDLYYYASLGHVTLIRKGSPFLRPGSRYRITHQPPQIRKAHLCLSRESAEIYIKLYFTNSSSKPHTPVPFSP